MNEFEYTPEEIARKIIYAVYDFSDDFETMKEEADALSVTIEELRKDERFNGLAHHLDIAFMDTPMMEFEED